MKCKVIYLGNYRDPKRNTGFACGVWNPIGISPALTTMSGGGNSCYKCARLQSKVISNACQMVSPTWLIPPLSCAVPASKTMAWWHRH